MTVPPWIATAIAAVLVVAALPAGDRWFGRAVVVLAAVALVEVGRLLAAIGHRPVLPAAAVAGLGAPLALTLNRAPTWDLVPGVVAGMLLGAFLVLLVGPRSRHVGATMGATVLSGLVVALGAGGLVLLRFTGAGFRWTLGLLLLCLVPDAAATVSQRLRPSAPPAAARIVTAGAIVGALVMAAAPPFGLVAAAALAVTASAAGMASAALVAAVVADQRIAGAAAPLGVTIGLRLIATTLFAAPVASFLALAVQV